MAGVNFEKYHGGKEVKRVLRHSDKVMRQADNHKNKHIDKSVTCDNWQLHDGYNTTCDDYDRAIDELDKNPKANKRHDRVTCFGIEIPRPKNLPREKFHEWHLKVLEIERAMYPDAIILNSYEHYDEIHEYVHHKTGEKTISREHAHDFIIPIVGETLNGKQFSCRKNLKMLNAEIQAMTQEDYGCDFMDGTEKSSDLTVEELKNRSKQLEYDQQMQDAVKNINQEDFLDYLSDCKLKSGRTRKELLEQWQKEYATHKQQEVAKEVERLKSVRPVIQIQDEQQEANEQEQVTEVVEGPRTAVEAPKQVKPKPTPLTDEERAIIASAVVNQMSKYDDHGLSK